MLTLIKNLFSKPQHIEQAQNLSPVLSALANDSTFNTESIPTVNPQTLTDATAFTEQFSPDHLIALNPETKAYLDTKTLSAWGKNTTGHVGLTVLLNPAQNTLMAFSSQLTTLITHCVHNYPNIDLADLQHFLLATPINTQVDGQTLCAILTSLNTHPMRQQEVFHRLQLFKQLLEIHSYTEQAEIQ